MDPISIAMGLAQFAPSIVKWITGSDKAEQAAGKVVEIAQAVTGRGTGPEALEAIRADQALMLQFRQAVMENEADLDKAFLADRQDARKRDVAYVQSGSRNIRADLMVLIAFLAVVAIGVILAAFKVPAEVIGFLTTVGGMFARNIGTAFDFEFGSSRSSREKDQIIAGK